MKAKRKKTVKKRPVKKKSARIGNDIEKLLAKLQRPAKPKLTMNIDGWLTQDCELVAPADMTTGHLINTLAMIYKTAALNQRSVLLGTGDCYDDEVDQGHTVISRIARDTPVALAMAQEIARRFAKGV